MFCPRCATQNSDDAKYCRACRENLKVIAQAMTRHLPVVLAGKLDELIERRNERLRRDSILSYIFGVSFLLLGVLLVSSTGDWVSSAALSLTGCYQFGYGIWLMLAYRRSLALNPKSAKLTSPPEIMYCPRCGKSNSNDTKFCHACGEDLKVIARALTRHWPAALATRLDKFIERTNTSGRILRQSIAGAVLGAIALFVGIVGIVEGGWLSIGFMLLACLLFAASIWDIVVYKRSLSSSSASADLPPAKDTAELSPPDPLQIAPPSVTEATTKHLDPVAERSKEKI